MHITQAKSSINKYTGTFSHKNCIRLCIYRFAFWAYQLVVSCQSCQRHLVPGLGMNLFERQANCNDSYRCDWRFALFGWLGAFFEVVTQSNLLLLTTPKALLWCFVEKKEIQTAWMNFVFISYTKTNFPAINTIRNWNHHRFCCDYCTNILS